MSSVVLECSICIFFSNFYKILWYFLITLFILTGSVYVSRFSLSFSLSVSLYLYTCLSLSLFRSLSISVYNTLSLFISLAPFLFFLYEGAGVIQCLRVVQCYGGWLGGSRVLWSSRRQPDSPLSIRCCLRVAAGGSSTGSSRSPRSTKSAFLITWYA